MSKIEADSVSPSPSVVSQQRLPQTKEISSAGVYLNGTDSANATPAPEPPVSAVASTSTLDVEHIIVDDDSSVDGDETREKKRVKIEMDVEGVIARAKKRSIAKGRSVEEEQVIMQTATRFASRLVADHNTALYPDVETPFADSEDAVRRLLPYHVFQHPRDDLEATASRLVFASRKGKGRATEEDMLREEIAETKFGLECWRRRRALEERFRRARLQSGKRSSPDDQSYIIAQGVLEAERIETTNVNGELRAARAELDKIERERRAAAAPPPAPRPTPSYYVAPPTTPSSAYASQYRGYSYPYAQGYGTSQYTFSPAFPTTPATYATPPVHGGAYGNTPMYNPATPTPASAYASSATYSTPTSITTTPIVPAQVPPTPSRPAPTSAIPVQLPVTSLPALKAIGLEPAAAAAVGQPQPAAVLKTQNSTTMNLEINVGSLQPAQMSGLALILNALTSRGVNVDGNSSATSGSTAAGNGREASTSTTSSSTVSQNST